MTLKNSTEDNCEFNLILRKVNCVKVDNYLTLNYKKMKKKRNQSHNFLPSLVCVYLWILSGNLVSSADYSLQKCDAATQQNIFETLPQCEPRTSLVDLRQYFEDNHDIIQVVPDHVMVERCGGSCYIESYDCIPDQISLRPVQVMVVQSKWPHGQHDVHCTQIQVPVHQSCKCGCKLKQDHCNKYQYYHEPSCRCICENTEERAVCIASNKIWDPDTCQCHCPLDSLQTCPTGYWYDLRSCACILIGLEANKGLIAGTVVLLFLSVTIIITLFIMHKQKTGLFKESSSSNADSRRSTNDSLARRTVLMSQKSMYEYETASKDADVTLFQFDLSKKSPDSQESV